MEDGSGSNPALERAIAAARRRLRVATVALAQGGLFLAAGAVSAVVGVRSERSDPARERGLQGALAVAGSALAVAGLRGRVGPGMRVLGAGSAGALAAAGVAGLAREAASGERPSLPRAADVLLRAGLLGAWGRALLPRSPVRLRDESQRSRAARALGMTTREAGAAGRSAGGTEAGAADQPSSAAATAERSAGDPASPRARRSTSRRRARRAASEEPSAAPPSSSSVPGSSQSSAKEQSQPAS